MRILNCIAVTALSLVLPGCGDQPANTAESYEGSRMVPVAISLYIPEGEPTTTVAMAGKVPIAMEVAGSPPTVSVAFRGSGVRAYALPRDCPQGLAAAREGRLMRMRVDQWRQTDGSIVERLPAEEVAEALCRNPVGRDLPSKPRPSPV